MGPEPLDGDNTGFDEYRNVGRGAKASKADTFHEICSESDDMADLMDSGLGNEISESGLAPQSLVRIGLTRLVSLFMGRPEVQLSVAGLRGVGETWLIALISASRS